MRWRVLALLFTIRTAMAFQFQTIGALSPLVAETYGVGLAEIGLLIGLYLAPGVVFAAPGGALAARFGDRRIVRLALVLMVAGGAFSAVAATWEAQIAARLLAGTGGVVINVVMSKMVTDWFAGREIATAMGLFVNSWPVGIALALSTLPLVAGSGGLAAAFGLATLFAALGFGLTLALPRPPAKAAAAATASARPKGAALGALVAAASIWALFNAALAMVFSFGPAMLSERGFGLAAAGGMASLSLWALALAVPFGGVISDRTGRRDLVTGAGLGLFAAALLAAAAAAPPLLVFIAIGVAAGLPVGPIMSLPAAALAPETRAAGMGLFYTLFYVVAVAGPFVAGAAAESAGTAATTFVLGTLLVAACFPCLLLFRRLSRPVRTAPAVRAA